MKKLICLIATLFLIAGCSTISTKAAAEEASNLLNNLEAGDTHAALYSSSRPFLFEGEILISEGLVTGLWSGLAGLNFSEATLDRITLVDGDSYLYFSDSWETATWFQNYTDPQTALVFYNWQDKELVLVVNRNKNNPTPVQGFGEVMQ